MKAGIVLSSRVERIWVHYGTQICGGLLKRGFIDDHTNIDWWIELGKLLLGTDNCSLEIVKFVSSERLSIDVVFSLEYVTSGKLRKEIEVFEDY